jgi:hypothetical protein
VQSQSTQVEMLGFLSCLTRQVTGMMAGVANVSQSAIQSILSSLVLVLRPQHAAGLAFEVGCRRLQWLLTAPPSMYLRNTKVRTNFLWNFQTGDHSLKLGAGVCVYFKLFL